MTGMLRDVEPGAAGTRGPAPSVGRWVALCAAAESIGMAASAGAAKASQTWVGEPSSASEAVAALSLVVGGGLVEGTALGVLQSVGLRRWLPALATRRWVLTTVAVAGLGWAAGSAPGVFADPAAEGGAPPWPLVLGGAAALGLTMGAALGAAQAVVMRRAVRFPWRWVGANALAWAPAMAVVFLGATTPEADWSVPAVIVLGAGTGAVAGAALGLVTGWFLPSLDGPSPHNRFVLAALASPAYRVPQRGLLGLRLRGVRTGRLLLLPVMYAEDEDGFVVCPGHFEAKRWWRNLRMAAPVDVLHDGRWQPAVGAVLMPGDPAYEPALATYHRRWPRARLPADNPLVRIRRPSA